MEEFELWEYLDEIYNVLIYPFLYQLRRFVFFNENKQLTFFIFLTIPLAFLVLEAVFDWIIPTLTGSQPIFFRRFAIGKFRSLSSAKLNIPEAKRYKVGEPHYFKLFKGYTLFIKHSPMKSFDINKKYSAQDLKYYKKLYCDKYNKYPTPAELKKFVVNNPYIYRNYEKPFPAYTKWTLKHFKSIKNRLKGKGRGNK